MSDPHNALNNLRVDGCYLLDAAGKSYLNLGYQQDSSEDSAANPSFGRQLAEAFEQACMDCDIQGRLIGGPLEWQIEFVEQEGASAQRILQAFHEEAQAAHLLTGPALKIHPAMTQLDANCAEQSLRSIAQRLRTLLIEHNSYLSGGLRYPFPDPLTGVEERGLAIYRFPSHAAVEVTAKDASIQIQFEPAELGEVTSSGFYLPTLFGGDFTVEAAYQIDTWEPCQEEAACFALFAQNESSSHRYYAQRMSTGQQAHRLLASLADVLSPEQDVSGTQGRFRIQREGPTIHCWHRSQDSSAGWTRLGSAPAPAESEMIIGAKIWSKIRCGGLQTRVSELQIEGQLATRQIPPVPIRSDPRSNSAGNT